MFVTVSVDRVKKANKGNNGNNAYEAILANNANNPDFIKNLLDQKKETAIVRILSIIPRMHQVEAKMILLKILPVFFSYAEVFVQNLTEAISIIRLIQNHALFAREKSLFNGWYVRLMDANKRLTQKYSRGEYFSQSPATLALANNFMFVTIPGTDFIDPIGYAELEYFNSFLRFLKVHKLHKYLYFFSNLSYVEIQNINEANIHDLEDKVAISPMTTGARRAILRRLAELNNRSSLLFVMREINVLPDPQKIGELLEEIKVILRTPIRGCMIYPSNDDIPHLLTDVIEKMSAFIQNYLTKKDNRIVGVADQLVLLLKRAWSCAYFSNEQKLIFNQLRWDITLLKKNFASRCYQKPFYQVHRENRLKMDKDLFLEDLISYMEEWWLRELRCERQNF